MEPHFYSREQGQSSVGDIYFLSHTYLRYVCAVDAHCTVLFAPIFLTEGLSNLDLHLVAVVA